MLLHVNDVTVLSPDAGRYEILRENAALPKQLYPAHNKMQELEWLHMAAAAEVCRLPEEICGHLKRIRVDKTAEAGRSKAEEDKVNAEGLANKAEAAPAHT